VCQTAACGYLQRGQKKAGISLSNSLAEKSRVESVQAANTTPRRGGAKWDRDRRPPGTDSGSRHRGPPYSPHGAIGPGMRGGACARFRRASGAGDGPSAAPCCGRAAARAGEPLTGGGGAGLAEPARSARGFPVEVPQVGREGAVVGQTRGEGRWVAASVAGPWGASPGRARCRLLVPGPHRPKQAAARRGRPELLTGGFPGFDERPCPARGAGKGGLGIEKKLACKGVDFYAIVVLLSSF